MGYAYQVRFRVVPPDGPEVLYDLTTLATTRGPVSNVVTYQPERTQRVTVNRMLIERRFGSRPTVAMRFELPELADEPTILAIYLAATTDGFQVFLSLNGGASEREVISESSYVREPLAGKNVGLAIEMEFRAVDIEVRIPALVADPYGAQDRPSDPGFQNWSSPTAMISWPVTLGAGRTLAQVTPNPYAGTYLARLARTTAGQLEIQSNAFQLAVPARYRVTIVATAPTLLAAGMTAYVYNQDEGTSLRSDAAWDLSGAAAFLSATIQPGAVQTFALEFTTAGTPPSEAHSVRIVQSAAAPSTLDLLFATIYGPIFPGGPSPW